MKIEDKTTGNVSVEDMYQVGNVIKKGSDLYLVASNFSVGKGYSFISLSSGQAVNYASYDSLFDLGKNVSRYGDILVKGATIVVPD